MLRWRVTFTRNTLPRSKLARYRNSGLQVLVAQPACLREMHQACGEPSNVPGKHVDLSSKRVYGVQYLLSILICHFRPRLAAPKYALTYAAGVSSTSA